jgi:hypothetical protein
MPPGLLLVVNALVLLNHANSRSHSPNALLPGLWAKDCYRVLEL